MFWIRSGLHSISISDWLVAGPAVVPDAAELLADARAAMLDSLGPQADRNHALLIMRIRTARDAQSLWALRPELMNAACRLFGEGEGRKRLARVTSHFESLVPVARGAGKRRAAPIGAAR